MVPKSTRRPVASMHAPDLYVDGMMWNGGRSIIDFMPPAKRVRKTTTSAR
jgi:hypothetical protein